MDSRDRRQVLHVEDELSAVVTGAFKGVFTAERVIAASIIAWEENCALPGRRERAHVPCPFDWR